MKCDYSHVKAHVKLMSIWLVNGSVPCFEVLIKSLWRVHSHASSSALPCFELNANIRMLAWQAAPLDSAFSFHKTFCGMKASYQASKHRWTQWINSTCKKDWPKVISGVTVVRWFYSCVRAFLCQVCTFSLCLCGFPLGTLASSLPTAPRYWGRTSCDEKCGIKGNANQVASWLPKHLTKIRGVISAERI